MEIIACFTCCSLLISISELRAQENIALYDVRLKRLEEITRADNIIFIHNILFSNKPLNFRRIFLMFVFFKFKKPTQNCLKIHFQ